MLLYSDRDIMSMNLVEMTGIEPVVTEVGRFTVSCHTITAASPELFGGPSRDRTGD